jgi:hypothetical protein
LRGAPKVWYILPAARFQDAVDLVRGRDPGLAKCLLTKEVLPRLSADDMQALGASRVLQRAGDLVVTPPGPVLHWTMSTGLSAAESNNFFWPVPGVADVRACFEQYKAAMVAIDVDSEERDARIASFEADVALLDG